MKKLRATPTPAEAELWEKEFLSGNDRATVIVVAARLDALLGEILEKHFLPVRLKSGEDDQLLSKMRPLASFSAKIYIARRLGLINESFEDALQIVRELRNTMAHEPFAKISLDDSPHKERVAELYKRFQENDIVTFLLETFGREKPSNFAGQYRVMMMMLLWALNRVNATVERRSAKDAGSLKITRYKRVGQTPSANPEAPEA